MPEDEIKNKKNLEIILIYKIYIILGYLLYVSDIVIDSAVLTLFVY